MKNLRNFKWKFLALPVVAAGAVVLVLQCANPVDDPPLRWLSKIEFPISNDSFNIAQTLPEMMTQFNDTIVKFWYRSDSLPWIHDTDWTPERATNHARYFAGNTVTYNYHPHRVFPDTGYDTTVISFSMTWDKNHVYEWLQKDGVWGWDTLGEVIDILMGGYDSTDHKGVKYDTVRGPDLMYLDMIKGDTVVMSIPRVDSICYSVTEDSMKTKWFYPSLGVFTIGSEEAGMREVLKRKDTLVLPAGSLDSLHTFSIPGVTLIVCDPSSPPCSVMVRNLSGATVTNCNLSMWDSVRNFGDIGPGDSVTRFFPVVFDSIAMRWGRGITGSMPVRIQVGSALPQPASIQVTLNLNGLISCDAQCFSKYITFTKSFINPYELTDTLECHYIDILDGFFIYAIRNNSDLQLQVNVSQLHLWRTSWCANHTPSILEKVGDLVGLSTSDSLNHMGRNVTWLRVNPFDSTSDSITNTNVNLSADRLFPEWIWDSTEIKPYKYESVAPVEYLISPYPESADRMVHVMSTDQLVFTIRAPRFKFRQMYATVRQRYERSGDMASVEMPFPFSRESIQSLQNNFRFKQVLADIYFTAKLPDTGTFVESFLDTLGISFILFNPDNPLLTAGVSTKFVDVRNNHRFRVQTNLTDIMNQWPDSMCVSENIYVPVGTRIMAVNDLQNPLDTPAYNRYMGRMNISAVTNVRTNMLFSWEVGPNPVKLDLGYGTFKVPEQLLYFNRLENPLASIAMRVFNHTNLYMDLQGLVAPGRLMDTLHDLLTDSVRSLISDTARAHQLGYISVVGPQGIRIPPRNQRDSSGVELQKWQIDAMLRTFDYNSPLDSMYDSTCGWRWVASFLPMAADTLADTDYVFIQSWLHVEGINNMDSLLTWGTDTTTTR